jgi:hypothetical protein
VGVGLNEELLHGEGKLNIASCVVVTRKSKGTHYKVTRNESVL